MFPAYCLRYHFDRTLTVQQNGTAAPPPEDQFLRYQH
jgi:hypothetical protein